MGKIGLVSACYALGFAPVVFGLLGV